MLRDSPVMRAWSPEIMLSLSAGPKRFNALLSSIEGISDRVLTERLRDLARGGMVDRQVIAGPPISVYYGLTIDGRGYIPALEQLDALSTPVRQEIAVG